MVNGTETELKLAMEPHLLTKLSRLPALVPWKNGRSRTQILHSTYFDTPEGDLRRAGISLRLRQHGRDWVQTIKDDGERMSGLFQRREWEMVLAEPSLNLPHILATGLAVFRDDDLADRLHPVFTTQIQRRLYLLGTAQWDVEMAIDHGHVQTGDTKAELSEVELELKRGDALALFDVASAIAAALPCRVQVLSKSDRGFQLAAGSIAKPVKALPVGLTPRMETGAAFQAIARNCLHQLQVNEGCLRGDHGEEAVHQMRVALRRLRSALKLFKPMLKGTALDEIKDELRWVLAHLGPARDGDVFLAEIITPVLCDHPDAPALDSLRQQWQERRDVDFTAALSAIDEPRFTQLLLRLGRWVAEARWLEQPSAHHRLDKFSAKVLKKAYTRMIEAGGDNLGHLPTAELHQVRILGKQMRYAGEFFASLYPRAQAKPFLTLMAELQESLGTLNDLAVAEQRLARSHGQGDWAWAAGLVCGWHEARRPQLLRDAQATWKKLRKTSPFWD